MARRVRTVTGDTAALTAALLANGRPPFSLVAVLVVPALLVCGLPFTDLPKTTETIFRERGHYDDGTSQTGNFKVQKI